MSSPVKQAAEVFKNGGLVIFPTETVFGIGCLISFPESIENLYKIKARDQNKPTHVLVKDIAMAQDFVEFNQAATKLANAFWPGPLTICLPVNGNVSEKLLGVGKTLGVRVSPNKFVQELFEVIDKPILAPSANFQGQKAPRQSFEIDKNLVEQVNYVVPLEPDRMEPSTIVSFANNSYNLVRPGPISKVQLDQVLANLQE